MRPVAISPSAAARIAITTKIAITSVHPTPILMEDERWLINDPRPAAAEPVWRSVASPAFGLAFAGG